MEAYLCMFNILNLSKIRTTRKKEWKIVRCKKMLKMFREIYFYVNPFNFSDFGLSVWKVK